MALRSVGIAGRPKARHPRTGPAPFSTVGAISDTGSKNPPNGTVRRGRSLDGAVGRPQDNRRLLVARRTRPGRDRGPLVGPARTRGASPGAEPREDVFRARG